MRIGFNLLRLGSEGSGGVYTYAMGLLQGLSDSTQDSIQIYHDPTLEKKMKEIQSRSRANIKLFKMPDYNSLTTKVVEAISQRPGIRSFYRWVNDKYFFHIAKVIGENSDIVLFPTTVLFPFCYRIPTIVSVHDIQHVHFQEFFSKEVLRWRNLIYPLTLDLASYVQVSSEFIKNDLQKNFPQRSSKSIWKIPEGVDLKLFSARRDTEKTLRQYNVSDRFLFMPGQLWPHKNHITLLKALSRLKEMEGLEIPLVMTGAAYSAAESLMSFIRENNLAAVRYLGLIPKEHLLDFYQASSAVVVTSIYESSSLPALEAAASGTPILAGNTPPNLELCADLKMRIFDVQNSVDLSEKIKEIWAAKSLEPEITLNRQAVEKFDWSRIAEHYLEKMRSL